VATSLTQTTHYTKHTTSTLTWPSCMQHFRMRPTPSNH
jgi:hypothetical protein